MKAVVFHGVGDIRLDAVPDPQIEAPTDAIVRITSSAICGTDLHMIRGTMPGMKPGTILGHEAVGIVEEVGPSVRNFRQGDRVVVPSTIACGYCSYCRAGYQAQCDNANPNGPLAGTAFYGGPEQTGPFQGLQAEFARIPYANANLVKLPPEVDDDRAILLSDIVPTGYFGAELAEIVDGDTVAVMGCGPVGQFSIVSAQLLGADRVIAVDSVESRLQMAQEQGAEIINFEEDDPVEAIRELTGGIGVDRIIDAVGVDAERPHSGPAAEAAEQQSERFSKEVAQVAKEQGSGEWSPGEAPSIALDWSLNAVAKAGTLAIIGLYPPHARLFPIGYALNRNLTIKMGNCNHRKYLPHLVKMVRSGSLDPLSVLTKREPLSGVIDAYEAFNERQAGWMKVELKPEAAG